MDLRSLGGEKKRNPRPAAVNKFPAIAESLECRLLFAGVAFASPVTTQISSGSFAVAASVSADLNGDGIPDLVVARNNLQAQVYLGTKTGTFTLGSIYASGGDFCALGDFNNDGKPDLATANGIYPGVGNGTFGALISGFTLPAGTVRMYAEDVNGDGNQDLVCATYTAATGMSGSIPSIGMSVLLGNGNGTFKAAITTTIGSAANLTQSFATLAFQDFNGDGKLDVVTPFGLMTGNGDGTFNKPTPLPYKGLVPGASALPSAPIFAIGDFNGDGNIDLATLHASGNTGNVEIFLGDGKGGFTDSGTIAVGTNETITALDADFLTSSGNTDLIAGVSVTSAMQTSSADVAVMVNNGNSVFAAPTLYPVAGPPVNISVTDFNGDGNPDLLSIDGIPNSTTSTTGLTLATTAAAFLNTQAALIAPVLTLRASVNPVVVGNSVNYTATVQAPSTSATGVAVPTGVITFFNGMTVIGTATLAAGNAILANTATGLGVEQITFNYGGDSAYSSGTSSALSQTVLQTGAKVPFLLPALSPAITIPAEFLPGDVGSATITLTNGGGGGANGKIDVNFYLSQSGLIDSSAIALAAPALQNRAVQIASGKSVSLTANLRLKRYTPGNYFLVAKVVPAAKLTSDEVSAMPVVSTTTFQAAGLVFGSLGTHHGVILKVADANGHGGTFSLTGPGTGTITQSNGTTDLTVTGTTTGSRLTIASRSAFILDSVHVNSVLNIFTAARTTLAGDMNLGGGVNRLLLSSAASISGATIRVGTGAFQPTMSLGAVGDLTLTSTGPITSLSARSWQSGAVDAPSIASLTIAGSFGANVRVHAGGKLKSASIGAITGGTWAVAGGIGMLHVIGSASGTNIYAGADTGPDDILGTGDDIYAAASIGVLFIGGSDTSTLIAAGAHPAPGDTTLTEGLALFPRGSIIDITLRGTVSDDSRFLAAFLPRFVKLNGAKVATAGDPHFQI